MSMKKTKNSPRYVIRCGERYVYSRFFCVFDINMARSFSTIGSARAYALKYLDKESFVIEEKPKL